MPKLAKKEEEVSFPQSKLEDPAHPHPAPEPLSQQEASHRVKVLVKLGQLNKQEEDARLQKRLLWERLSQDPDRN